MQDGRAWPNFVRDYLPMVDRAVAAGIPIIAANAPRRYVSLVGRQGLASLHTAPLATPPATLRCQESDSASTGCYVGHKCMRVMHTGLPTAPDALAMPSEALMTKISREMAAARTVSSAAQPVCGTPTPTSQPVQPVATAPCLLYTSPSPRDRQKSRMPSSA